MIFITSRLSFYYIMYMEVSAILFFLTIIFYLSSFIKDEESLFILVSLISLIFDNF